MDWTPLDLKNQAALFDDMADAVLAYRMKYAATLSDDQKSDLTTQFGELISAAEKLEEMAVAGALANIGTDVKDLQNATHDAIAAVETVANVQRALSIAVAAAALGVAIATENPGAIATALGTLVSSITSSTPTSTTAGTSQKPSTL
jgi:hypothetical protein